MIKQEPRKRVLNIYVCDRSHGLAGPDRASLRCRCSEACNMDRMVISISELRHSVTLNLEVRGG